MTGTDLPPTSNLRDKSESGSGVFPRTRWTHVANARETKGPEFVEALDYLTRQYWRPIFRYLRRQGSDEQRAKDLTQSFILHCLEKSVFAKAEQSRGRFRTFLLTALKNFTTTVHRHETAQSRRPEGGVVSIDALADTGVFFEPPDEDTPDQSFHRAWIASLVERVVRQLRDEARHTSRQDHFKLFHARLVAPALYGSPRASVKDMAAELGIDEKTASNCVTSMKRRFKTLFQDEVRLFASHEDEVAGEIDDMLRFLSK